MKLAELAELLTRHAQTIATAESCTGGLVAKLLTDVPGSSAYYKQGFICYSNDSKTDLLGVTPEVLEKHGAVSAQVAVSMAMCCRAKSATDFAIAVTGIAGPGGGTADKPVGLVYIALADISNCEVKELHLDAELTRAEIRLRATEAALEMLKQKLQSDNTRTA